MKTFSTDYKTSDAKLFAIVAAVVMAGALRLVVHGMTASPEILVRSRPTSQAELAAQSVDHGGRRDMLTASNGVK
jgi:hypothetical protein